MRCVPGQLPELFRLIESFLRVVIESARRFRA